MKFPSLKYQLLLLCALAWTTIASSSSVRTTAIEDVPEDAQLLLPDRQGRRELNFLSNIFCIFGGRCRGDDDDNNINDSDNGNNNTNSTTDTGGGSDNTDDDADPPRRGGIFGRPIFGNGGIFGCIFGNCDDDDDNNNNDSEGVKGPLGILTFPEDSLLGQVFDQENDRTFLNTLAELFQNRSSQFTLGIYGDWLDSVTFTDTTCNNVGAPECLASNGEKGFWVCRELFNPFTGVPTQQSQCIIQGNFIAESDTCNCCSPPDLIIPQPQCPTPCSCTCDLNLENGVFGDGVRVLYDITYSDNSTETDERCVSPAWANTMLAGLDSKIRCQTQCP